VADFSLDNTKNVQSSSTVVAEINVLEHLLFLLENKQVKTGEQEI